MKLHKKKKLKSFIRALSQLKKMDLAISNVITDPQAEKTERNTENCISIYFNSRSSLNWFHEKCVAKRVVNHVWIWNLDRSLTYSKTYFCQRTLGQEKTNRENCVIRLPTQSWKTMTWHSVMRALKPSIPNTQLSQLQSRNNISTWLWNGTCYSLRLIREAAKTSCPRMPMQ